MKYLIIVLLAISLFSCDMAIIPDFWSIDTSEDLSSFSIKKICSFSYKREHVQDLSYGKLDYWKTPQETYENGGDCEDLAILALAIIYKYREQTLFDNIPYQASGRR